MTAVVAYSTLLVLLAQSNQDFRELWDTLGAVNDPTGLKYNDSLIDIIQGGNFKSALVDDWTNLTFDSISLYGTNKLGDVFWEIEFNVTSTNRELSSWLLGTTILYSSAVTTSPQSESHSGSEYRFSLGPLNSTDLGWFAVSRSDFSYGPLPLMFVPRNPDVPFKLPVFMEDGRYYGCWRFVDVYNVSFQFTDTVSMTPDACMTRCRDNYTVAMLQNTNKCYCADVDLYNRPSHQLLQCYLLCPNTLRFCGGVIEEVGSSYHVQGSTLPGHVDTVKLYDAFYPNVKTNIQIDGVDMNYDNSTNPAYITQISVLVSGTMTYNIKYSNYSCVEAAGHMKDFTLNGATPVVFLANGSLNHLDILKVRCIEVSCDQPVTDVSVMLYGPDVTSTHIQIPVLAIRGKTLTEAGPSTTISTSTTTTISTSTQQTINTTDQTTTTQITSTTLTVMTSTDQATTASVHTTDGQTTTNATTPSQMTTTATTTPGQTTTTSGQTTTTPGQTTTTSGQTITGQTTTTPGHTTTTSGQTTSTSGQTITGQTTTTPGQTTTTSDQTDTTCFCPCNKTQLNLTEEELQEVIYQIQLNLSVNVSQLSSTIRRLTSVRDPRESAAGIGYMGISLLTVIAAGLVLADSHRLFTHTRQIGHKIKKHFYKTARTH